MSDEKDTSTHGQPEPAEATQADESSVNDAAFAEPQSLDAVAAERDAAHEKWLRAEAEIENVRRRMRNELDELRKYQSLPLARDVLSPLDNLRLALAAAQSSGNVDELVKGIEMVLAEFDSALGRHNATPIESEGVPFDPNLHEAIQQVPSADHEPMTVLTEVQRGYVMHDRVIRPSKVVVSAAPPAPADDQTSEEE